MLFFTVFQVLPLWWKSAPTHCIGLQRHAPIHPCIWPHEDMRADMFTKPLPLPSFSSHVGAHGEMTVEEDVQ